MMTFNPWKHQAAAAVARSDDALKKATGQRLEAQKIGDRARTVDRKNHFTESLRELFEGEKE